MIQLYKADNNVYEYNGNFIIKPYSCELEETINDTWMLTLEYFNDGSEAFHEIKKEAVIAAPTPNSKKQLFRIYQTEKTNNSVIAYAFPIFLDAANEVFIKDTRVVNRTGQEALNMLMQGQSKYSATSDITDVATSYFIRKNLVEAIASDDENSFLNRWKGEIYYDNFKIIVNKSIGSEYGIRVSFGKNMTGMKETIDTSNMATRIVPVAYNGYMLDGDAPWVDSPLINNYAKIYFKVIEFEDIKMQEDCNEDEKGYQTLTDLRNALISRCNLEFQNGIDLPTITYEVDMIDISRAVGYEDVAELEKIHLGDIAECINRNLNISTRQKVVSIVYDCISQRVAGVTLGSTLGNYFDSITSTMSRTIEALNDDGTVKGERISGVINLMQSKLRASREIAQAQSERAILFEDKDPESSTYGAMALGTTGFEIASYKDQNDEWVWTTFGTGEGFMANCIIAGIMYSTNYIEGEQGCKIDLDTGTIEANVLQVKGNMFDVYVQNVVNEAVANSGNHDVYAVEEIPTMDNQPAVDWYIPWYPADDVYPSDDLIWEFDYSKHVGSLAYLPDGTCYVFRIIDGEYKWVLMEGSDTTYILKQIAELKVNSEEITGNVERLEEGLRDNYYTITETNSRISQTADEIESNVSKTYTPLTKMGEYATITQMNSSISQSATNIKSEVSATYSTKTETGNVISEVRGEIELKVDKDDNDQIVSMINASANVVNITANRFTWQSQYSEMDRYGRIKIKGSQMTASFEGGEVRVSGNDGGGYSFMQGHLIEVGGNGKLSQMTRDGVLTDTVTANNVFMNNINARSGSDINIDSNLIIDYSKFIYANSDKNMWLPRTAQATSGDSTKWGLTRLNLNYDGTNSYLHLVFYALPHTGDVEKKYWITDIPITSRGYYSEYEV